MRDRSIWDVDGDEFYLDYHAAFGPHFLGHNDPYVNDAVIKVIRDGASLFGSGTTAFEGKLAELICTHVPAAEMVQVLNTGSEATYQALRLARAFTGRNHIIRMQGGYNGSHDDVACNLMTPLTNLAPGYRRANIPFVQSAPESHRTPATDTQHQLQ